MSNGSAFQSFGAAQVKERGPQICICITIGGVVNLQIII